MSYAKTTDFSIKDVLLTGNPSKVIKGSEINTEFDAIATADAINVKGPIGTTTDNAVMRWDTATGRAAQNSLVIVDDAGNMSATSLTATSQTISGTQTVGTQNVTTQTVSGTSTVATQVVTNQTATTQNVTTQTVSGISTVATQVVTNQTATNQTVGTQNVTTQTVGGQTVTGNQSVAGTSTVNAQTVSTNQSVLGSQSVSGGLSVAGTSTLVNGVFNGNLTVNGTLIATGMNTGTNESLVALSNSIHLGAIVKSIIYDTSKDSDGGAWCKRMQDKSWYTETLGGDRWIGQQATIAAAWTAAGSVVGAVFQASATAGPLTSGKYYQATSATTATEVTRGISREFPALPLVVAQTATLPRVVVYDGSQSSTPMWRVFTYTGKTIQSAAAFNGRLYVATTTGVFVEDLVGGSVDKVERYTTTTSPAIVNNNVNDVAITVLDTAPTDPATSLPVPTIAVATAGGLSTITNTGTVVNSTVTTSVVSVDFDGKLLKAIRSDGIVALYDDAAAIGVTPTTTLSASTIPATLGTVSKGSIRSKGSTFGVTVIKRNPAVQASSLVSYITNAYNSGWQVGDIRGAYLADTTAETITASGELVTNGTFTTDTSGWTAYQGSTLAVVGGELQITSTGTAYAGATQTITTVIGRTYTITTTGRRGTCALPVTCLVYGFVPFANVTTSNTYSQFSFVATGTATTITLRIEGAAANGETAFFDNISVKLADADRSVKNIGLVINGTLTKTAVASGAGLVAYSGFSASNYLEQPYNSQLDFGTGDFCVMGWANITTTAGNQNTIYRGDASGGSFALGVSSAGSWSYAMHTAGGYQLATSATTGLHLMALVRASGVANLYIDGVLVDSRVNTNNVTNATAKLQVGCNYAYSNVFSGSTALWRISATAPSADQIAHIYRTELPLFQAGAQCTIAGTSTAVTALAYDDVADELHVGTSWGRSEFRDLLRVASEATTTGAITSLSANEGVVLTGGASSGKVYAPAMYLRDELRRKDVARKALGRVPAFFDYTATASQTAFVAPKGFTVKALYKNGTLMRETTTGVYWTRSNDGFQETATLSVGATVSDWISLMCVRA